MLIINQTHLKHLTLRENSFLFFSVRACVLCVICKIQPHTPSLAFQHPSSKGHLLSLCIILIIIIMHSIMCSFFFLLSFFRLEHIAHYEAKNRNTVKTNTHMHTQPYTHTHTHEHKSTHTHTHSLQGSLKR